MEQGNKNVVCITLEQVCGTHSLLGHFECLYMVSKAYYQAPDISIDFISE